MINTCSVPFTSFIPEGDVNFYNGIGFDNVDRPIAVVIASSSRITDRTYKNEYDSWHYWRPQLVALTPGAPPSEYKPVKLPQGASRTYLIQKSASTGVSIVGSITFDIPPGHGVSVPFPEDKARQLGMYDAAPVGTSVVYNLLPIEINVNDTADAKDDMVRKEQKIGSTAWRQWIPCTVKIPESGPGKTITSIGVTAESGTMKFVQDSATPPTHTTEGAANVAVTLDAQGQGKFWITGITQSTTKGDAKLQIRKNGATGDVLATQPMTVFWFDATITFPSQSAASKAGNLYGITNPQYAWTFSGEATIKPAGLDSTAPQIANMRLGFIQNVQTTRTWHVNNPSVQAGSGAPSSSTVTVASTRIGTVTWQGYVLDRRSPQSRMLRDQRPLYDGYEAFDVSGKSSISNDDSPQALADTHSNAAQAVQANQTWPVTVDYQWEKTVIQDDFLLWLGVADDADTMGLLPNPTSVTPIRQVDWKFHADSSANGLQTPTGGTHKAPDTVPVVTGQTANQRGASPASYQWQDGNQNTNLHP